MKNKFIYVLFIMLAIGCNKDDDDSITGAYKISTLSQSNCDNASDNINLNFGNGDCQTSSSGIEYCQSGTLNFSADGFFTGTLTLSVAGVEEDPFGIGTYIANGSSVTICDSDSDCIDLIRNGNTLTVIGEGSGGCNATLVLSRI